MLPEAKKQKKGKAAGDVALGGLAEEGDEVGKEALENACSRDRRSFVLMSIRSPRTRTLLRVLTGLVSRPYSWMIRSPRPRNMLLWTGWRRSHVQPLL